MKTTLKIKTILFFILLFPAFSQANTAPKCSAVIIFQRSEIETKVTAIVKTIATHQMKLNHGLEGDQYAYNEATRQINEITHNFPEMLQFYMAEIQRLMHKSSPIKKEVQKKVQEEKDLIQFDYIDSSVVFFETYSQDVFIFKKADGTFFVVTHSKEFEDFFYKQIDIQSVVANKDRSAIAILKKDGTVVTKGKTLNGGDSSGIDLTNVHSIQSTTDSFAALKNDGTVVTWPEFNSSGNSSQKDLTNVQKIFSNYKAFAALKNDGTVVTWGSKLDGGDSSGIDLTNVQSIYSTVNGFAALKNDGTVVTWGYINTRDNPSHPELKNVKSIYSNDHAFVALKNDGSAEAWGGNDSGGNSSQVNLINVKSIHSTSSAFAALKNDGTVVTWGSKFHGGTAPGVDLTNVKEIYSTGDAYAALKNDGTVTTWGYERNGGDSSPVKNQLYGIIKIIEIRNGSFIAIRKDGKYILWGKPIGNYKNQVLDFDLK